MHVRSRLHDARAAPWARAAPFALIALTVLATGLLVADGGGWRQVVYDYGFAMFHGEWAIHTIEIDGGATIGATAALLLFVGGLLFVVGAGALMIAAAAVLLPFSGGMLFVVGAAALVVSAAAGWRWISAALAAAMGVAFAGWVGDDGTFRLGYTTTVLRAAERGGDGPMELSITMSAVVALLLAAAFITALGWAIAGRRARRRGAPMARPRARWWLAAIGIATLIALPLPRVALWLRDASHAVFGTPDESTTLMNGAEQTLSLLLVAIPVVIIGTAILAWRRSTAALAGVIVCAALWAPVWWLSGSLTLAGTDQGAVVFASWVGWFALGTAAAVTIAARINTAQGQQAENG